MQKQVTGMCPKQLPLLDLGEIPKAARGNGCYAGVAGVPEAVTQRRAGCTVHCADVLEWAAEYSGPPFHAVLCDPPYELGFMGKDWDKSGIAFDPATWAALAEHMLPGAFGMAFASARGWHRLAVAIEDAGLIIHPSIFGWTYGSGLTKGTRVDTQVDDPDLAETWEGHRYGLQALKPALEPIIIAQKDYEGRPVDCITGTGAGALNIDCARIKSADNPMRWSSPRGGIWRTDSDAEAELEEDLRGRWPANLYLTHHSECKRIGTRRVKSNSGSVSGDEPGEPAQVYEGRWKRAPYDRDGIEADGYETVAAWDCHPDCPVRRMDTLSGERGATAPIAGKHDGASGGVYNDFAYRETENSYYDDEGGAARFFFNADWSYEIAERLAAVDPVTYAPKACRRERDAGLGSKNDHPAIKPIRLMTWLARLLLPPQEYAPRRLLVPFAGSGSEMIGAMFAGWDEVVGIERDEDYVKIARARLDWWAQFRSYEEGKAAW